MISVIISTHNRKGKLERALTSVLSQSFTDYEIIISDDCSTDGTEEYVKKFISENPTIKVIYHKLEKNFGNDTKPKNEAIKLSSGDLLAFLDDDNEWRVDHLQALYNALKENDKFVGVYGDRWVVDDDGKEEGRMGFNSDYHPTKLLYRNFIDTSDILIKKSAVQYVGGFDERYSKYIDWNLWLRLSKAGFEFERVNLILTNYHISSETKSAKNLTENEKKFIKATGKFVNIPDWKEIDLKDPSDFGQYDLKIHLDYLGETKIPTVAIFTLTHDRLEYTQKAFESLRKTAGYSFAHFIIDNGSQDETPAWLKEYQSQNENVHLILSPDNKGISLGSDLIIEEIKKIGHFDIIMKVDNDCLFLTKGWLQKMIDIWKCNHRIALSCFIQGLRDNPGGAPRIGYGKIAGELIGMTKHLGGICHFVDAHAYDDFKWQEDDRLHGMQDMELSQYLIFAGYQMGYLESFFCEHMEGTEGQHKRYPEYFERRAIEKTTSYESK